MFIATSLHAHTPSIDKTQFQHAVAKELAKHQFGQSLYDRCESYRRLINFIVRRDLGLIHPREQAQHASTLSQDTTILGDPYDDSDDQDETSVVINRGNPSIICIGANEAGGDGDMFTKGMPAITSTDKGLSWQTFRLPFPQGIPGTQFVALGDPMLASDDRGNIFYAYLAGDGSNEAGSIVVAISQDGIDWSNRTAININKTVVGAPDKEHMTIDLSPKSPYYGRVYMVWFEFYGDFTTPGEGLNICWSDDKCKTWSKPVALGTGDNFQEVKTNSKGDIFVGFSDSQGFGQEMFVSTNGGKTFTKRAIRMKNPFSLYPPNLTGRPALKGDYGFRAFPYVAFDIDLTSDRIHCVYPNSESLTGDPVSVLYYTTSDDNCASWSIPKPVGVSNPKFNSLEFDRFMPWVSIDQSTGEAWAMYYSSEEDPNNAFTAAYRTKLTTDLKDFPEKLNAPFDPLIVENPTGNDEPFIGDYLGSDAYDSIYVATWTENHPDDYDGEIFAYIRYPNPNPPSGVTPTLVHGSKPWLSVPYPNPVSGNSFAINYFVPNESHVVLTLTDIQGNQLQAMDLGTVNAGSYHQDFPAKNLSAGIYYLQLTCGGNTLTQKVIVE
ncbi:MAG: T9SS type A sorting domain-containing protein [bacterium]